MACVSSTRISSAAASASLGGPFRATSRRLTVFQASHTEWLAPKQGPGFLRRQLLKVYNSSRLTKLALFSTVPIVGTGVYLGMSVALCDQFEWSYDRMFIEDVVRPDQFVQTEHFFLVNNWDQIKQTLAVGDVLMYTGTDTDSRNKIRSQFAALGWRSGAQKFSNVAVVVSPYNPKTGKGPFILEAVENKEDIPDWEGKVRRNQVQIVDASDRLNAMAVMGADGRIVSSGGSTSSAAAASGSNAGSSSSSSLLTPTPNAPFPCYKRATVRRLLSEDGPALQMLSAAALKTHEKAVRAFATAFQGTPLDTEVAAVDNGAAAIGGGGGSLVAPIVATWFGAEAYRKLYEVVGWGSREDSTTTTSSSSAATQKPHQRSAVTNAEVVAHFLEALGFINSVNTLVKNAADGTTTVIAANSFEAKKALWLEKRRKEQEEKEAQLAEEAERRRQRHHQLQHRGGGNNDAATMGGGKQNSSLANADRMSTNKNGRRDPITDVALLTATPSIFSRTNVAILPCHFAFGVDLPYQYRIPKKAKLNDNRYQRQETSFPEEDAAKEAERQRLLEEQQQGGTSPLTRAAKAKQEAAAAAALEEEAAAKASILRFAKGVSYGPEENISIKEWERRWLIEEAKKEAYA